MLDSLSKISALGLKEIKRRIIKKFESDYRVVAWLKEANFPSKLEDTFESIYLHALADYHLNWDPFELTRILKARHVQEAYYEKIFKKNSSTNGLTEALRMEGELLNDIIQQDLFTYLVEANGRKFRKIDGGKLKKHLEQFEALLLTYRERVKPESSKEIIQIVESSTNQQLTSQVIQNASMTFPIPL